MTLLTKEQRVALERYVLDCCLSSMFGDGMEDEYVMDGFPAFKGIRHMSDDELVIEANNHSDPEEVKSFLEDVKARSQTAV